MFRLHFFSAIALLSLFASCGKDKPTSCTIGYEFVVPFSIGPTADTIAQSDTLWISSDFTNVLQDHVSGKTFTVNDFEFKTNVILRELVSDTLTLYAQPGAYSAFNFKNDIGSIEYWANPDIGNGKVVYKRDGDHFKFRLGVIPKRSGVFTISLNYPVEFREKHVIHVSDTKCEEQSDLVHYDINNGADNHLSMLKDNSDISFYEGADEPMYRLTHWNYTFAVK